MPAAEACSAHSVVAGRTKGALVLVKGIKLNRADNEVASFYQK